MLNQDVSSLSMKPVGGGRSKAVEEEGELALWFLKAAKAESKKLFGKYLRLS
jgi:hypothetical protein